MLTCQDHLQVDLQKIGLKLLPSQRPGLKQPLRGTRFVHYIEKNG